MLDTANLALTSLVAHGSVNPKTQRELQLQLGYVLNNAPTGITIQQKQLALLVMLEQLTKEHPPDFQATNNLAIITAVLLGTRSILGALDTHVAHQ
jgi:hypothetical protein